MYKFRGNIASKFGVTDAVVAEYLYTSEDKLEHLEFAEKVWYRCSAKRITVDNPFLTIDMTKHAIKILRNGGIIRSKRLLKSNYDHTNWYTFTEYGEKLMNGGEINDG